MLGALLQEIPGLPAWCHARWHLAQAEVAERGGNASLAEEELAARESSRQWSAGSRRPAHAAGAAGRRSGPARRGAGFAQ